MPQIELDDYEITNLREGLIFLREVGGDTGDWFNQVLNKLPDVAHAPNKTAYAQKSELARITGWRLLWPGR